MRTLVARAGRLAAVVVLWATAGAAAAEGEPPPLKQISDTPTTVHLPAAPDADVLVERMAFDAVPVRYSSQDYVANQDDSQAADDFCIPAVPSWTITHVDVAGVYNVGGYSTPSVKVFFLKNNGSLPGTGLYTATVTGASLSNVVSGSFAMTLTTPAQLAGNNCYWVSVQAIQPGGFNTGQTWQWIERTAASADHSPSAYRRPGKPLDVCHNWGARLATCYPSTVSNPDFTLRLSGSLSDTNLTPQIATINPPAGLNEDISLTLTGLNFAPGATLSWTVGVEPTEVFAVSIIDGGQLTAQIPSASVGPEGSTALVQVLNPGPCQGSCASNTVSFDLTEREYLYIPFFGR